MSDPKMKTRWIIVIGAILVQLCLGAIYAWSAFTTHLQSSKENLIFNYSPELLGLDEAEVKAEKERIFGEKGVAKQFAEKCDAIVEGLNKDLPQAESNPKEFDAKLLEAKKELGSLVYNFLGSANLVKQGETMVVDEGGKETQKVINSIVFKDGAINAEGVIDSKLIGEDGKFTDEAAKEYILPGIIDFYEFKKLVEKNLKLRFEKTPPVKLALFNKVSQEKWDKYYFGFSTTQTQWIFSISLAVFVIAMIFAGRWQDRIGPRIIAMTGGIFLGIGYLLAGLLGGTNHTLMFIFIGIIGGTGLGLGYVCPIAAGSKWFPDKKGLISGLAVAGFGAGASIFIKLAGAWGGFINNMGVNSTFTIFGIIFLIGVLVGAMLLKNPPKGWVPEGWDPSKVSAKKSMSTYDFAPMQIIKTRQFYFLWIALTLSSSAGLMVIGTLKDFGYFEGGISMAEAASAIAMLSIFNAMGRIIWGWVSDKIGRKFAINLMIFLQGLMMIGVLFIGNSPMGLTVAACWIGFNFGGNFALFPAATADYFGLKNLGSNYGLVFTAYGVGGILGPILAGKMYDITGSYTSAYITIAILLAVALFISLMFRLPKAPKSATEEAPAEA